MVPESIPSTDIFLPFTPSCVCVCVQIGAQKQTTRKGHFRYHMAKKRGWRIGGYPESGMLG